MTLTFVKQNLYSHKTWFLFYLKTTSNLICKVLIVCSLTHCDLFLKESFELQSGREHCHLQCIFCGVGRVMWV